MYRLDRLARDLAIQEQLISELWRTRKRVFSTSAEEDRLLDPDGAADDPSRKLIRQVIGSVNEYERAMIRLRMRAGKQAKAARGGYVGGSPSLGYRAEGRELVPDTSELAVVARAKALRAEGLSQPSICQTLSDEGMKPKRSDRWHPTTIARILSRSAD